MGAGEELVVGEDEVHELLGMRRHLAPDLLHTPFLRLPVVRERVPACESAQTEGGRSRVGSAG